MEHKKSKIIGILLILLCFVVIGVILAENFCSNNNPVSGNYRESNLSITLDRKNQFEYYNAITNTTTTGEYTYQMSEDGEKAYITLIHNSRWCSYDGAVIYFFEGETWLVPTIDGSEVPARRMVKVS